MQHRSFFLLRYLATVLCGVPLWLMVLFGPAATPAGAGVLSAFITLRAVVRPFADLRVIREPVAFTVTEEDVRKGYVVGTPMILIDVRSNSPQGCVLTLYAADAQFKEAQVTLQGRTVIVGPQGGMIVLNGRGHQTFSMQFRFLLAKDTRPGTYPWPFSLAISPLE